jgi:ABC-type histidine transport system ATPase subunit
LENFKEGDIAIENETMELIKDKEGKWKPYTVLDYMAK